MYRILFALALVGCDGGALGLVEEEMVCPKDAWAVFEGFGPVISAYQGTPDALEGPLPWKAYADQDAIKVHCTPDMTVYLVR
jgi:hypothetical protein